jgi:hypothetical protein
LALADAHGIELVGGDTTAGPLNLCITVFGQVPPGQALLRSGARPATSSGSAARWAMRGWRWRSSAAGGAAGAPSSAVRRAMELPQPRVALGLALRGLASSAIDLSDGLLGDLGHVLQRSAWGRGGRVDALPRSAVLARSRALQRECLLAGGDDYELLFTAPPRAPRVRAAGARAGVPVTRIGRIETPSPACASSTTGRPRGARWRAASTTSHDGLDAGRRPPRPTAPARRRARPPPALHAAPPGALDRAGLRQRPVARGRRARWARCGPGCRFLVLDRWLGAGAAGAADRRALLVGWWACTRTAQHLGVADPGAIVWDEVVAFWLVLWLVMPARLVGCSWRPSAAVPLLRRRQARAGGLGRPALQAAPGPGHRLAPGLRHPVRRPGGRAGARCWSSRCGSRMVELVNSSTPSSPVLALADALLRARGWRWPRPRAAPAA